MGADCSNAGLLEYKGISFYLSTSTKCLVTLLPCDFTLWYSTLPQQQQQSLYARVWLMIIFSVTLHHTMQHVIMVPSGSI